MSLLIAIALNIALCVALLAALAWTMTRPRKLRPHMPARSRLSLVEQQNLVEEEQDRRAA